MNKFKEYLVTIQEDSLVESEPLNEKTKLSSVGDMRIKQVAKKHLGLSTLNMRNRDSLDFHELSVDQIKKALEIAYKYGYAEGQDDAAAGA